MQGIVLQDKISITYQQKLQTVKIISRYIRFSVEQ
jgi:hypothetical protein